MPNNIGAFGENFPYSNQHDMNMDWIIKIAKDFLDQYTQIQQTIDDGMEGLENKATELENLLQAWYDTHSEDIANELADALNDLNEWYNEHENYLNQTLQTFTAQAEAKGQEVIESIPQDYSDLAIQALKVHNILALSGTAPSVLSDCNNAVVNTAYHFIVEPSQATTQRPANFPTQFAYDIYDFLIVTIQASYQSSGWKAYKVQYVMDAYKGNAVAIRTCNNNVWSNWESTGQTLTFNNRLAFTTDAVNVLADFDTMKNYMLYQINVANASELPAHAPSNMPLNCFAISLDYSFSPGNYTLVQKRQFIFHARNFRPLFMRDITSNATGVAWTRITSEIIVDASGKGDFTSLTDAVANTVDGDIIYVRKGTYNNEEVQAWGKNITIIGEDKYQTIIKNTLNNYNRPPLEMTIGHIENLTIYQENGGSTPPQDGAGNALHMEDNSLANGHFSAKNVIFKSDLNHAVGIGMRPNCEVVFEDCDFWSRNTGALFYHDSANGTVGVQNIKFVNCTFYTEQGSYSLKVHDQKWEGSTIYNTFIRCTLANGSGTAPVVIAEDATSYTGTATSPIGDFYNLVNFFKGKLNYGNNVNGLNY